MTKKSAKQVSSSASCYLSIKPQRHTTKEAICEVCDKVFETDKDILICPNCHDKSKIRQINNNLKR